MIFSYLVAPPCVVWTALGALLFLMIVTAILARWPTLFRRLTEVIAGVLPLCALLFIPVLFGLRALYSWTAPSQISDEHLREVVQQKLPYLRSCFFIARTIGYFAAWTPIIT